MGQPLPRVRFGDYTITRELPESPIARRLLALDPMGRHAKVLHLFPIRPDDPQVAVLRRAVENLQTVQNRHVLPVEKLLLGIVHQPCAVTPLHRPPGRPDRPGRPAGRKGRAHGAWRDRSAPAAGLRRAGRRPTSA
ncbi:MAG: hypothetical protein KatS3mg103_0370 [Phycisphaerales bacterium]|nr:MAG: hypothetical protein KatS3mg103_0370 [Phycisphaerales bacterium]